MSMVAIFPKTVLRVLNHRAHFKQTSNPSLQDPNFSPSHSPRHLGAPLVPNRRVCFRRRVSTPTLPINKVGAKLNRSHNINLNHSQTFVHSQSATILVSTQAKVPAKVEVFRTEPGSVNSSWNFSMNPLWVFSSPKSPRTTVMHQK